VFKQIEQLPAAAEYLNIFVTYGWKSSWSIVDSC